jgi:uncharacterized protein (DUF305 family)
MPTIATRVAPLLAASVTALFLSACTGTESDQGSSDRSDGHTDHQHSETQDSTNADSEGQAPHNAADVSFAQEMMPHHKQALELTDLARDRSTDPVLLELAAGIAAVQGPEMGQLADMLRGWGENPDADMGHGAHASMPGMVDDATMSRLRSLDGRDFDTLWLESMISHHQGAIEMARAEIADGQNAGAKEMAQHIADTQQAEIDQMQQMLGRE